MSGSMNSSVGNSQVYNDGDQRPSNQSNIQRAPEKSYEAGQENAHDVLDSKDQRTIGQKLAAASTLNKRNDDEQGEGYMKDPTRPARDHGNEPSRGAKIDAELKEEEEQILRKKGL